MNTQQLLQANIIELMGLQNLPEEQKQQLIEKMTQTIQDRVLDRLLDIMSAEQRQKFDQLLETNPEPTALDAFLKTNVPDYEQVTMEEIAQFKKEMADQSEEVRKMVAKAA